MLLHHDRTFEEAGSNDAGASTWDRLKSGGYRKREARPGDPETNIPREEEIVVDDEALMQELTSEAVVLAKAAAARAAASGGTITATAATSGQAAVPIIGVVGGGNAVVPPLPSSGSLLVVATGQNLQQAQQVSISPMKFKMRREERMIQEKRRLLDTIDKQEAQRDAYRLYLNVERIRVSECLFRPEIVGLDGQGVGEWIESFQCPVKKKSGRRGERWKNGWRRVYGLKNPPFPPPPPLHVLVYSKDCVFNGWKYSVPRYCRSCFVHSRVKSSEWNIYVSANGEITHP